MAKIILPTKGIYMKTIDFNSNPSFPSKDISTLYVTHLDTYFSKVEELRQEEDWRQMVLLGELALTDKDASFSDIAKIHAQIASCYFYLGEYDLCAEHANKCHLISEYLDEPNFLIRSLYLLSAHKRTLANLSQDPTEKRELFGEARSLINKAIKCFDRCNCPLLRAKVLFNGGAAHSDDPNGDLKIAICWYKEAMEIFSSLGEKNDYARTAIRLGKAYLLQDRINELSDLLNQIQPDLLPQKTKVHYKYLQAQYYAHLHENQKAASIILDALEIANRLGMKVDIQRLNALLEDVQDKPEEISSFTKC